MLFRSYNLTSDTAPTGSVQTGVGPALDLSYVPSSGGTVARTTSYGAGCYTFYNSFYESFATSAAFDLSNTTITMLPTGGGSYQVIAGSTPYVAPSSRAQVLPMSDDTELLVFLSSPFPYANGTTNSLAVCANGYVSVASGNGTGFTPNPTAMLNAPQTGWWAQHDYNPA